ncbi:MAG: histidine phosphatase family protein [Mycobacteriales bacterium]
MSTQIVLVRHAETRWSQTGQHTGTTDLPLLAEGRRKAQLLGPALAHQDVACVLTSPLLRARETCELAGFGSCVSVRDELTEWNYGQYEGCTTEQVLHEDPSWLLWRDGAPGGESPQQVQQRLDPLIEEFVAEQPRPGAVLVFAHGHVLQALALRWVGVAVSAGPLFDLGTASVSRLGWKRESRVIQTWNDTSHLPG